MRNQYKILAEKYEMIKENYTGDNLRSENLFDYFKDKPGFNFFAQWLAVVDYNSPGDHIPDYNNQEQINMFFSEWLDNTYDNYIEGIMDEQDNDDSDENGFAEIEDEAEDRMSNRLIDLYMQFKNDPNSEQYKAWKSYEAAQEEIKNASDTANVNLDI
jgi:hypothetical protein